MGFLGSKVAGRAILSHALSGFFASAARNLGDCVLAMYRDDMPDAAAVQVEEDPFDSCGVEGAWQPGNTSAPGFIGGQSRAPDPTDALR